MKKGYCVTIFSCFLIFSLLRYPHTMLAGAIENITMWALRVLPSLLPFMIACSLLLKTGAAETAGQYLSPFMKPVFGLSGIAAFPFFLGIFSGYPMGAKITAALYADRKITLEEAEHILCFSNNPGPLFLIGTVGTAFFNSPFWGYIFLLCTFLGAVSTGILFRLNKPHRRLSSASFPKKNQAPSFSDALSSSIADSIDTIIQIGGYVLVFGITAKALEEMGGFAFLGHVFAFLPFSAEFLNGFAAGILEMTNGAYLLSQGSDPLKIRLTAACCLVAFGGLSILGQTLGILSKVPIKKSRYIAAKLLHAICSGLYFFFLFPFFETYAQKAVPAFAILTETAFTGSFFGICSFVFLILVLIFSYRKQ